MMDENKNGWGTYANPQHQGVLQSMVEHLRDGFSPVQVAFITEDVALFRKNYGKDNTEREKRCGARSLCKFHSKSQGAQSVFGQAHEQEASRLSSLIDFGLQCYLSDRILA